jgi:hypothetical protein
MSVPGYGIAAAVLFHGENPPHPFVPMGALITPLNKMQQVRTALAVAKPGDMICLGDGKFAVTDHGMLDRGPIVIPPGVHLRGMGRGRTLLWSNKQIDADGATLPDGSREIPIGPAFSLSDGCTVEGIDFENVCYNPYEDGGCIGFTPTISNATATIRDCSMKAGDWTVYDWSPGNTLTIEDSVITGGRVLLANEDSGIGSTVLVYRTQFFGDAKLSVSVGEVSNKDNGGVFGVVSRGGLTRLVDCEMTLSGSGWQYPDAPTNNVVSATPRVCGITDMGGGNGPPSGTTRIEIYNLRCAIDANGSDPARCWALDVQTDYVQKNVSWSANDETLSRSWTASVAN